MPVSECLPWLSMSCGIEVKEKQITHYVRAKSILCENTTGIRCVVFCSTLRRTKLLYPIPRSQGVYCDKESGAPGGRKLVKYSMKSLEHGCITVLTGGFFMPKFYPIIGGEIGFLLGELLYRIDATFWTFFIILGVAGIVIGELIYRVETTETKL